MANKKKIVLYSGQAGEGTLSLEADCPGQKQKVRKIFREFVRHLEKKYGLSRKHLGVVLFTRESTDHICVSLGYPRSGGSKLDTEAFAKLFQKTVVPQLLKLGLKG